MARPDPCCRQFYVDYGGQQLSVAVPPGTYPGQMISIQLPAPAPPSPVVHAPAPHQQQHQPPPHQQHQRHQPPPQPRAPTPPPAPRPLPAGWEQQRTPDGQTYYIDHRTQVHPPPASSVQGVW
jgi:hypothetical protein